MSKYAELIERLEKADGPDRELDKAIGFTIDGWEKRPISESYADIFVPFESSTYPDHFGALYPDFTASVAAALGLVERALPGWGYRIGTCCVSDDAFIFPDFNSPEHGERLAREFPVKIGHREWADYTDVDLRPAGRLPIAILISLLTALEAIQKLHQGSD